MSATVQLLIAQPGGQTACHRMSENDTVTVGSKKTCGLRLNGDDVSPIHCILKTLNGRLFVQDWYASSGTSVAGEPVCETTAVQPGQQIRVGACSITWLEDQSHAVSCDETSLTDEPGTPADDGPSWESAADSSLENDEWESPQGSLSVEQETLELLRSEVERLQFEVVQRDEQILDLSDRLSASHNARGEPDVNDDETARLVVRMEELLDELEHGDARTSQLQETLRCAEEAAQAARDERTQIEAWVADIERRVTEKEEEWKAGQEALQQRLRELVDQRDQLKSRMRSVAQPGDTQGTRDAEVRRLREENERLQETVEQLRDSLSSAQQAVARCEQEKGSIRTRVESDLREGRTALAQERALLTRQQSEIAALRAELVRTAEMQPRPESDADARLRAFRDHLREIHDQERSQQSERTLVSRLAQLWRRVEKRNEL